jgi:hypothetical protein
VDEVILAQPAHLAAKERLMRAMQERTTRGLLLYNRERHRIHQLAGAVWAVPSSQGGYWRVNLADETCGCQDFRYQCTDRETGVPFMNCKHITAAAIARVKAREQEDHPHACTGGYVYLGYTAVDEATGEEVERVEALPCRRCSA